MANLPIPGIVELIDLTGSSASQHGEHESDIILYPQPTNSPNDPLNWSPKRRLNSTVWQMLWVFFSSMAINGLTPVYLLIEKDTEITVSDLNADAKGWRFVNQIYSAIGLPTAVGTFFFFEETMFFRPSITHQHQQQIELHSRAIHAKADEPLPAHKDERGEVEIVSVPSSDIETGEVYELKTYGQKLKLWGARDPRQPNTFFKFLTVPLKLLRFPLIVFSGLLVGSFLAWFNVVLGTTATIFGGSPYNFSTNQIGLTYFSCMIGISVGCWLSGWANDKLATFIARRNSGVKEPEARLWIALVPVILHSAGCALYGIGAAHGIHWAGFCVGLGIVSMTIVMGATLAFSYVVDCYREVVAESVVTVVLIRNIFGFAFAYAISPMINDLGLQGAFLLVAFVGTAVFASCFLVIALGKSMRKASRTAYWRLVEDYDFTAH